MRRCAAVLVAFTVLALVALFQTACGPGPTEPVTLVNFDLRQLTVDPTFPIPLAEPNWGLHWLGENWDASPDSARGVWAYGPEARAHLHLLGRDALVRLVVSTQPKLSDAGQAVTVLLNDQSLGRFAIPGGWADRVWEAAVPPGALREGDNVLTLRPHRWSEDGPAYAVYVRELAVVSRLTAGERQRWSELTAVPEQPPGWELAPVAAGPAVATETVARPDVLLILPDATWAAHVSCYGYGRPTTPNLDALAAEGIRLGRCFSVAPVTGIAVPSLLTGLHWRQHGVYELLAALPDTFATLAEILAGAGYHTIAFTDSPFVSYGTGAAQGFAEFTDLWLEPEYGGGPCANPELAEQRLLARAREGFGSAPVFAYLHLMPPHAPYLPGPEHDLWSDPHYTGTYDGSVEQLDAIAAENRTVSDTDRDHIVDLYDGHLHRIDASLGRMVAGWRDLRPDRALLVIVVSDHGEAFGQHGYFQHLSTVHDEMLHVPLVLWPRAAWEEVVPDRARLLPLTDVAPLLLRRLGLAPPAGTRWTARNHALLAGREPGVAEIVIRTTPVAHTLGLRTERYLAVFDGLVNQGLYDLKDDPGARRNLRGEQPERYRSLLLRLRSILAASVPAAAELHRPSEQAQKTLKSLGY